MTFIHNTKQKSILTRAIVLRMIALFTGTVGLIFLYNKVVNLNHAIGQAKAQLEAVGASSTQMNNQVVAIIGGGDLTNAANEGGLVLDPNPQYFPIPIVAAAPKASLAAR